MRALIALTCTATLALMTGCSAISTVPGAETVDIVTDGAGLSGCKYLGEVVGSQGNWLTGDITSNKNLMVGARNDLRNEAFKRGANIVLVQDAKNVSASGAKGTTNSTMIGKAYRCS